MTHADLVERAARWLKGARRCQLVLVDPAAGGQGSWNEKPDAIGFTYRGVSVIVEAKASRSDFLSDKHKGHRRFDRMGIRRGLGDERWYLAPKGVILPSDELHGWGRLELRGSRVYRVSEPVTTPERPSREVALLVSAMRWGAKTWPPAEPTRCRTCSCILAPDISVSHASRKGPP